MIEYSSSHINYSHTTDKMLYNEDDSIVTIDIRRFCSITIGIEHRSITNEYSNVCKELLICHITFYDFIVFLTHAMPIYALTNYPILEILMFVIQYNKYDCLIVAIVQVFINNRRLSVYCMSDNIFDILM